MDIRTIGLLAAIAGAATMATAHAAPAPANDTAPTLAPSSYTELLTPIADPITQLQAHDATLREQNARDGASANTRSRDIRKVDHHHHHHHGIFG